MIAPRYILPARLRGVALAAALLFTAAAANPRLFHADLKKSEPSDKAVLTTPPTELKLWFSETPTLALSKVTLTRDKDTVAVGALTRGKEDAAPVIVRITRPVGVGSYTVRWRAMVDDGHVSNGTFGFTVKAAAPAPDR